MKLQAPYLTSEPPRVLNVWDELLQTTHLWSPFYLSLPVELQRLAWDYFHAGERYGAEQALTSSCPADHQQIFADGMAWARRQDETATDQALFDQFNEIRQSTGEPYWVLAERRGEPERAHKARQRAIERGYAL